MRQKHCAGKGFRGFFPAFLLTAALIPFVLGQGIPAGAAETGRPPSSVVVVEPGYPAEKPAEVQTDTRSVTVGDGSLPPVPVRVVRRAASGDVETRESSPVAVPSQGEAHPETPPAETGPNPGVSPPDVPVTIRRPTASTGAEVGRWRPRNLAIVVSDGAALSDPEAREEALSRIAAGKFTRVLLSFGPGDLEVLSTEEGSQRLHNLLRSASEKGLAVDLLLPVFGPGAGEKTASLLEFFSSWPFRSVQLDLDTETVTDGAAARQWIADLESAVAAAGRPVGVTLDSRVLEGGFGDFVASAFYRLNLTEVALTLYSTNAEEVAARFQGICRFYVDLPFSLVQSVQSDLPRTESYFTAGVTIFGRRMNRLCFDIAAANAQDLIIDSFESYAQMAP